MAAPRRRVPAGTTWEASRRRSVRNWQRCPEPIRSGNGLIDAAEEFWEEDTERIATLGPKGIKPWDGFLARGLVEANQDLLDWLRTNRSLFTP